MGCQVGIGLCAREKRDSLRATAVVAPVFLSTARPRDSRVEELRLARMDGDAERSWRVLSGRLSLRLGS